MKKKYFLFFLLLPLLVFAPKGHALQLVFKRVIFENSKRADYITFINTSDEDRTYRIGWREILMGETTGLTPRTPEQIAQMTYRVSDMVKYSPRRVTVPAKSSQQVRLMLRRAPDLPDGEYRSHILIERERSVKKKTDAQKKAGASATIRPTITLPIFVRKGNLSVTLDIVSAIAQKQEDIININITLKREGDKSVYTNVHFICNPSTKPYLLKRVRGIALYTEIEQRHLAFKAPILPEEAPCQNIKIKIVDRENATGDKGEILATSLINVL